MTDTGLRLIAAPAMFGLSNNPFHILKNIFKHRKVRYRGLDKNTAQLHSLFALANMVIARAALLGTVPV